MHDGAHNRYAPIMSEEYCRAANESFQRDSRYDQGDKSQVTSYKSNESFQRDSRYGHLWSLTGLVAIYVTFSLPNCLGQYLQQATFMQGIWVSLDHTLIALPG